MASILIAGNTQTVDYTWEAWTASAPSQVYSAWAGDLGVSDTSTLETFYGDDNAWQMTLAAPVFSGGPSAGMFSSEAGLGFYRNAIGSAMTETYLLSDVSLMHGLVVRPTLLLTFHPTGGDLQSLSPTRIQRSGSTTILFGNYKNYTGTNTYRLDAAIKITPGAIEAVIRSIDTSTDLRWFELSESTTHSVISNTLVTTIGAGTTVHLTASLGAPTIDGRLADSGPLRAPVLLGAQHIEALVQVATPLGWWTEVGDVGGARALLALRAEGLLSVAAPVGALSSVGTLDAAGVLRVGSPLPEARLRAHHDFSTELAPAPSRYVMDVVVNGVALRVPISTWQATQQIERACYLQCSIPACAPWVDAIQSASEFVISRLGRAHDGSSVEVEMARAPIESRAFDQGPLNYTATIWGYTAGLTAPDGVPGNGGTRALAGVRSVSFGNGGIRARASIDWMLKPGDYASASGRTFVADYINYYVPATGDAYMDAGERG